MKVDVAVNKSHSRPLVVFGIVGFLLFCLSYTLTVEHTPSSGGNVPPGWAHIIKALETLSSALLTVVALGGFWRLVGGDPIENALDLIKTSVALLGDSSTTGLRRVLAASGGFGSHSDWMGRLRSAQQRVDLMGYTLLVWTKGERFHEEIVRLVRNGVKVRVLIMDEDNPSLSSFTNTSQIPSLSLERVKREISDSRRTYELIKKDAAKEGRGGSVEIRYLKNGMIVCQLCIVDTRLTAVQYLYAVEASHSPLLEVVGSGTELFRVYEHEFEKLWSLAHADSQVDKTT